MKKNDLILIGALILIGVTVILVMNLFKTVGSSLVVTNDGKVINTLDLKKDTTFTVELENGQWNVFEIKDGYVDMIDASCPDKLCVEHRNIHYNRETIVCLPNKVILTIENAKESEVDAVAN